MRIAVYNSASWLVLWLCVGLLPTLPLAAAPALVYAPLPLENLVVTEARNRPLVGLLADLLARPVEMRLFADHTSLLDALARSEIDLIELGPLPFLLAKERTPGLRPLATFRESDGSGSYRCVLVAPVDGVTAMMELRARDDVFTLALTRPQSTCGPTTGFALLTAHGISLSRVNAVYHGGHDDVALAVLREQALLGSVKESVAQHFHALGLRVLAASEPVPGFVLAARPDRFTDAELISLARVLVYLNDARHQSLQNGQFGFESYAEALFQRVDGKRVAAMPFLPEVAE